MNNINQLKNNNNDIKINTTINYNDGKYIGEIKNGMCDGKGIDMKVIIKMIKEKEKEYIIIIMEIDMKVIIKMINKKEKEYITLKIEIAMKVIIKMIKKKEKG